MTRFSLLLITLKRYNFLDKRWVKPSMIWRSCNNDGIVNDVRCLRKISFDLTCALQMSETLSNECFRVLFKIYLKNCSFKRPFFPKQWKLCENWLDICFSYNHLRINVPLRKNFPPSMSFHNKMLRLKSCSTVQRRI